MNNKNINFGNSGSAGFTLIELMVVVAIIGILTAITATFLMGARNRAHDTASIRNLGDLRTYANLYYLNHGDSYAGFFASCGQATACADTQVQAYLTNEGQYADRVIGESGGQWFAYAKLRAKPGQIYCVDSQLFGDITPLADNLSLGDGVYACQ